ncbi:transcriptional regulator [Yersinia entomophaga]|uniref:Transcriptional regulator n=1 Tax=Yersinia entomophaga TaxID=935293 RepID=A0ABN4PX22_YERET|nr:substrate-binding domain-containing protein [Yersinia entomophaga]ANI31563.1 transcriptional regulator [Yersinia entomophaga]OWF86227.1 transcriptional regulator [Yersinia entomophaga]
MSLKMIAKELKLSTTTVSRALNGYSDVSAITRQRVEAVAERLGYRPNALARRLKMGKTDAIGLVYPFQPNVLNDASFLETISTISAALALHNIDLLLVSDVSHDQHPSFIRLIESQRVDALIVAHTQQNDRRLRYLAQHHLPFLAMGRSSLDSPYAWFDFDNRAGTLLAVEKLVELGHRRIAYLGGNSQQTYVNQRLQGYLDGLANHQIPLDEGYQQPIDSNRRAGYLATLHLLALPQPPTAIVTDSNMLGDGAAMALQQHNLLGSQGISLIVFDGLPADSLVETTVTPIVQETRAAVGEKIADMTLALIEGAPVEQLQVLWQPKLGVGDTLHKAN